MKKRNILAVAMSVSLVLGGAYYANTNNNLAYAEEQEEKSLDQLISEKQAEIEKLKADTESKEDQIAELEKGLKDLTQLNKEFDDLLNERLAKFAVYKPQYEEFAKLDNEVKAEKAKQKELYNEWFKLNEEYQKNKSNKELKKKKDEVAKKWAEQKKLADEKYEEKQVLGRKIAPLGAEIRAMDEELYERKVTLNEEEDFNYKILDKIYPLQSDVKNNNRKVLTLNTQIQGLEKIKADLAKDNEESGKPLDEQIIDKEGKVTKLQEDIDNKKAEIAKLEGQILDISELKNNFALKEQALNQNSEDFKNARDELEQAKTKYENANEIRKKLYNSWYEAKQKLNKNPGDKKLEKEVYDKAMACNKQEKIANAAKEKVRKATAKASALSKENSIIVKEYEVLRDDLYAKEEINDNLNFQISLLNTTIEYYNKRIKSLNNKIDEINEAIDLEEEKESLIEKIVKLNDLSDEDKEKAIEEITNAENKQVAINAYNKAFSLNQDNKYEREKKEKLEAFEKEKEEAKEALDKLADKLSPEDLKAYKEQIDKANTSAAVQNILEKAEEKAIKEEEEKSKKFDEYKQSFLDKLEKLSDLTDEQKQDYKEQIEKAISKAGVNKAYNEAYATNQKSKSERLKKEEQDKHDSEKEDEKPIEGASSKEEAIKAAKKALENDPINKSYDVKQGADGKWYYVLSPIEKEDGKVESETKENENKKDIEDLDIEELKKINEKEGFATKDAAIKAAKKVLKKDLINKSYSVAQGANGNYFFLLSPLEFDE